MAKATDMLTPRQYAVMHGVAYTTVMNWLNQGLISGANKEELPFGGFYWKIPKSAPKPVLKSGPKPKASKKARRGKSNR
jgi:hypothetical protein